MENLQNGARANGGRSMSCMHPGTSDRVVELMIATQLKGLGGRRNKQCRPVTTGCQLRHEKMATRNYGHLRPENCHMPYYLAAFPNLQKALARKGARTVNELLSYSLSFVSCS